MAYIMRLEMISLIFFSFLACYLLTPVFRSFAQKKGYITALHPNKLDTRRLPYLGGIAIYISFLVVVSGYYIFSNPDYGLNKLLIFIAPASLIVIFGLYDDIKELKPLYKFIAQCVAASILVISGIRTEIIFLNKFSNILISVVWIILITNAFNLLDIMDGLAAGIALISFTSFFLLGFLTGNVFVILICLVLAGAMLAFLRYNLPPASIFMGDVGSQFLGFCLAVISMDLSFSESGHEIGIVIPLMILAVPLFDLFFVIVMRLCQRKSIFLKSNDHFVFRMLKTGMSNNLVLKVMLLISIFTNLCAAIIYRASNVIGSLIFLLVMAALFSFGIKLSKLEMNK
ncbi:MAG: undecaprenyl/decaprenyl-phosphate alpha-N-acetylglucosaminyl 1-phosphate transferase [Candidatus Omnitrophica bacterium]|nr:undecaprenyl/decaprenyl-phosphate alpha-N-acetylglucosaminyl 1-phosphate transferase [Candidatus Omnitrophota bacterium]